MTAKEAFGYMWECPDLFEMSGKWFLLCCPQVFRQKPNGIRIFISPGISCVRTSHWKIPITHVIQKHSASWIMALISMPPDIYGRTGTAHSDRLGGDPGGRTLRKRSRHR